MTISNYRLRFRTTRTNHINLCHRCIQKQKEYTNTTSASRPPNEIKSVRVIFNGQKLPTDRESLYWINIYEVPAIKEAPGIDKYLLMSMKTQLKLIYRPKNLTGNVNDAGNSVSCSLKQDNHLSLTCRNNSGYVLSYNDIIVNIQGKYYKASADLDLMIKPFSESFFSLIPISVEPIKTSGSIIFKLINDKGEIEEIKKTLPTT